MTIVKKLHNFVALTREVTGRKVYVVFEVNERQFLRQVEGDRDTSETSVVHSQTRGSAHCHKLIVVVDWYNTLDPSHCTNIWKAQGSSIGRNYLREYYKSRILRNFPTSFTTNTSINDRCFALIRRVAEERRRHVHLHFVGNQRVKYLTKYIMKQEE